jgi:ABC-2 type transport system ATP-binding protein
VRAPGRSGLSLAVGRGEVVALLGPNGAGKTTTISMLLGLVAPDRGAVELFGAPPQRAVSLGRVGAVLQDGGMLDGVRVGVLLAVLRSLYVAPITVERALIGNPELLVLDEPTAAMDVEARHAFWDAMHAQAARGSTIVFSPPSPTVPRSSRSGASRR